MRIALFGLPQTGKTTVFRALSGLQIETAAKGKHLPNRAVVKVPDPRLDKLTEIYEPKKKITATIEYIDMPSFLGNTPSGARFSENFLMELRTADALAHVVRVFESDSVAHISGKLDFERDIKDINTELIFADLAVVESALTKMQKRIKADNSREAQMRKEILNKCKTALEEETPLRLLSWEKDEEKILRNYQFLSQKPFIVVLNLDENQKNEDYIPKAKAILEKYPKTLVTAMCGQIEMEISQLSEEDQLVFLEDLGLTEPALNRFVSESFQLLDRMYFFTVGKDEVRAWEIARGTNAVNAAGCIHSDLQQGFICAEVFNYQDVLDLDCDVSKLKEAGKLRLEGKEYEVKDGDILCIRFNVSKKGK